MTGWKISGYQIMNTKEGVGRKLESPYQSNLNLNNLNEQKVLALPQSHKERKNAAKRQSPSPPALP